MVRKGPATIPHIVDHHPGGSGTYWQGQVSGVHCWLLVLYLPASPGARMSELRDIMSWAEAHLLLRPTGYLGPSEET